MAVYYIIYNGAPVGPMTADQVAAYDVDANTQVSVDGGDWRPLYTYPELMEQVNRPGSMPPPPPHACSQQPASTDSRRVVCGVLAILIGGLGLQYFLVGKTAGGFINILLAVVTCGLWTLINFIQGIMILCMSDEEWKAKYVYSTSTFPVF